MKKIILIIAIAITGNFAHAQKVSTSAVPTPVLSKFSSLYPTSKAEGWKKEKDNYETKFMDNQAKKCIQIDPTGNVVKVTTTIAVSELPAAVIAYVKKNYPNDKITKACRSVEPDEKIGYEVRVKESHMCFDSDGAFLRSEKQTDMD
jgi:hypothetical protein